MKNKNQKYRERQLIIMVALLCGYTTIDMLNHVLIKKRHKGKVSRILDLTQVPLGIYEMNKKTFFVFMTEQLKEVLDVSKKEESRLNRNKKEFEKWLGRRWNRPDDHPQIYCIPCKRGVRFVKITEKRKKNSVCGMILDVTEEVLNTENLKRERDRDVLTGIQNRNAFQRRMLYYNNPSKIEEGMGMGMFDLNNLKNINDTWGHNRGDDYIFQCAKIICRAFPNCGIFRIGGDEFAGIFLNLSEEKIKKYHEDMCEQFQDWNRTKGFNGGIAFGYAIYNKNVDRNMEDVLRRADCQMYQDKIKVKD
ncbi:MAG: GGDEF domain-containing protein [Acetivibrio sp.]